MNVSITETAIRQQLLGMRSERFEIGVLKTHGKMTLRENQSIDRICKSISWLRRENACDAHIFIRPIWPHALSLIDDLSETKIEAMGESGFEPAVVIETSPNNFQAWLNHGQVLADRSFSTLAARELAVRFGGDCCSADWRHFGRLAGFTNQKKERRLENGLQPFVKLRSSEGRIYSAARQFLCDLEAHRQEIRPRRELRETTLRRASEPSVRSISSFHGDPRYGGDLHRADMAWALHAADRGLSQEQIANEIVRGRDLSKKGSRQRQFDYAVRTSRKAIAMSAE
jgi:hypothetical protein